MKALISERKGEAKLADVPVPDIKQKPAWVQVKVQYVALNPTDWKGFNSGDLPSSIIGCDFSGIIEEVGPEVKTKVAKGDKIAGIVHGSNKLVPGNGTFAEHLLVKDGLFMKVPESLSMQEASTLGVGVTTVAQGLFQSLQLPWPTSPTKAPFPVLIYGGSTATGTLAIQFAKMSGVTVLATSRKHNFDLLKSLGADAVYDYTEADAAEQIRKATKNGLHYVFDCISLPPSLKFCAEALSSDSSPENHLSALLPTGEALPRKDVNARTTMAYSALGEPMNLGMGPMDARPDHYDFARKFWAMAQDLFEQKKLKVHPVELRSGGLEKVLEGLEDLKNDRVSGQKLVYQIA